MAQLTKRGMSKEEKRKEAYELFQADYWSVEEVCDMVGLLKAEVIEVLEELMSSPKNEVLMDTSVKDDNAPKRWKININALL